MSDTLKYIDQQRDDDEHGAPGGEVVMGVIVSGPRLLFSTEPRPLSMPIPLVIIPIERRRNKAMCLLSLFP